MKTMAFIGSFKTFQPGILDELDTVAAILEEELGRKVLYITVLGDVDRVPMTEPTRQELDLVIVLGPGEQADDELDSLIRRILKIEFGVTFDSIFLESNKFLVETLLEPQLRSTSMEFYRLFKFAQFALEDLKNLTIQSVSGEERSEDLSPTPEVALQAIQALVPLLGSTGQRGRKTDFSSEDHQGQGTFSEIKQSLLSCAKKIRFSFLSLFLLYYFNLYPDDLQTTVEISLEEGKISFAQVREELRHLQEERLMEIQPDHIRILPEGLNVLKVLSLYITAYQNAWLEYTRKKETFDFLSSGLNDKDISVPKMILIGRNGDMSIFELDKLLASISHAGTTPTENLILAKQVISFFKDSEILLSTYLISFIKFLLSHGNVDQRGTHLIRALRYDYHTRPQHYLLVQLGPRKRRLTADFICTLIQENWLKRLSFDASPDMLKDISQQLFEDVRDFFLSSLHVRNYILETSLEIPYLELQFMLHVKLLQMVPVLNNFPSPIQAPYPQLTYHENWKICRPHIMKHALQSTSIIPEVITNFEHEMIDAFYRSLFQILDFFVQDVLLTFGYLPSNDTLQNVGLLQTLLSGEEQEPVKERILERLLHRCATINLESEAVAIMNNLTSIIPRIQDYLSHIMIYPFNVEWNDEMFKRKSKIWMKTNRAERLEELKKFLDEINDFYEVLLNVRT